MSWTDERVTLLKKLWGEGKTAAEIAKALGGVTRNAVIGKAHRLNLSNRVSPIQQNNKKSQVVRPQQPAAQPAARTAPKSAPAANDTPKKETGKRIPLLHLKPNMCRWPMGDPREKNFGFCGEGSISGLPYCADHAKAAYQAAGRGRLLQAEDLEKSIAAEEKRQELRKAASGE
ncbi:MAG: gcrA cell cycle regulator family protein [Alphaproteobacteria bacterium]|nr:gcrA cell cycle regulator family protein [Alphaproteobacteria bacterium]